MDLNIRQASIEDAPQIAKVHVESWQTGYAGIIDQDQLDALNVVQRQERWVKSLQPDNYQGSKMFLAFEGARLAGFSRAGPARSDKTEAITPGVAELYCIYVDPAYFGLGVGKALFNVCADFVQGQGYHSMFVKVLIDNKRGRNFYQRMGAIPVQGSEQDHPIDGRIYKEMTYLWEEI